MGSAPKDMFFSSKLYLHGFGVTKLTHIKEIEQASALTECGTLDTDFSRTR